MPPPSARRRSRPARAGPRSAGQMLTVSCLPGRCCTGSGRRPAARHHRRPRRRRSRAGDGHARCAAVRARAARNRRSPARPPGRSTRAASAITRAGSLGVMQHLMDGDGVEARRGQGRWYMSPWRTWQLARPARSEVGARHDQHLARQVDADAAADPPGHQLEDAAGAGADVEQVADARGRQAAQQRGLDLALVDMERAELVPARGILAEIGGGARPRARRGWRRAARGRARAVASSRGSSFRTCCASALPAPPSASR